MADRFDFARGMAEEWPIKPTLAQKMTDILIFIAGKDEVVTKDIVARFGISASTANRYLYQLAAFGYIIVSGNSKNRTYCINAEIKLEIDALCTRAHTYNYPLPNVELDSKE